MADSLNIVKFTEYECKILINILKLKCNNTTTLTSLAKFIGINCMSPKFRNFLQKCLISNIIIIKHQIGPSKIIEINEKQLKNVIDEQDIVNFYFNYFTENHICEW